MDLLRANNVDDAMAEFSDALRVDRGFAGGHFGLAECMERMGRIDDALKEYAEGLQIDPKNVRARYGIGSIYLTKGKINEAIKQFMMVQMIEPGHVQAKLAIGKCLEKRNLAGEALQEYRNLSSAFPDFVDAYLAAARCLVSLGRTHEAVDEYRKALARAPERIDIRKTLIKRLENEGYLEEAIKEYREILAAKPEAIDIALDMASVMDRGGMIKEAIEEYARIKELDQRNAFAHKKHAALINEREKIDQLTDRYLSAVINRMSAIGSHFREGMKLYIDGCYDDALGEFVSEVTDTPTAEACFGNGACLVRTGNLLAAVPGFRQAIELKPDFEEAHTMLGILYERHGLLYEASEEYEKGVKEARDKIKADNSPKRKTDGNIAEPTFHFYRI
ncbi:MAG: tetratricopeptide repeat protein [Methanocella sp.]